MVAIARAYLGRQIGPGGGAANAHQPLMSVASLCYERQLTMTRARFSSKLVAWGRHAAHEPYPTSDGRQQVGGNGVGATRFPLCVVHETGAGEAEGP